jgi:FkbH-like protein
VLAFWMRELVQNYQIRFAQYNQVFQQLLDPSSLLARNRSGVNVVLVRLEDWLRFDRRPGTDFEKLEDNIRRLISSVTSAVERLASPLILSLCPASPEFLADAERAQFSARIERLIASELQGLSTVHVLASAELSDLYPVADYYDEHGDELGHLPYTPLFFAALGTMLARKIHAIRTDRHKVIVLDCDETLWQGICGEDGPGGIVVDPPRQRLQEFMLAQRSAGMLLCLISKNNEEDVLETFRMNPDMPLRLEHFAASRINWEPKSSNLISMAEELDLGLDTFILVDDNPKECAEVEANCPEALALALPADPAEIPEFLRHVWAFDHAKITEEDRRRAESYSQRAERGRMEKQAASLEEFLASLQLEVRIRAISPQQLPRVAQLTQRTSQMNATTIRRNESEIQEMLRSGYECLTVDVTDRFGSYGLTGVILFRQVADAIDVDTFLLSCRALGRGVEHHMLASLGQIAIDRGLARVEVPLVPTARNAVALAFLESAGSAFESRSGDAIRFRFPAGYLTGLTYQPGAAPVKTASRPASPGTAPCSRKTADLARIARELRAPELILESLRPRNGEVPVTSAAAAPRTPVEERVAAIWAELLNLTSVGIHDNFFDLGGHSLLAVQLLSRVRQAFDVDLSLEVVYTGAFTVAELAKAIELRQIEQAGSDRYAALLEELEGLSDDEVAALLAQEENGNSGPGRA